MRSKRVNGGYLLLEDGTSFPGEALFSPTPALGEAVFNTSHSGYQEILTDPSYRRQLMVFTAAHIGNVGINDEDMESDRVHVAGAIVRNLAPHPRNWRAQEDLAAWLDRMQAPLLAGADTRAITLHLRQSGAMRAGLFPAEIPLQRAWEQIKASPLMSGADLAAEVTCSAPYAFTPEAINPHWHSVQENGWGLHVAVLDFGVKRNILRELARRGCQVTVLPAATPAAAILGGGFNGLLLSNGPGDPEAVAYGVRTTKSLLGRIPIFGICLGHQLLALAAGFSTYKLLFGHRGANHPVRNETNQQVEITSQNHGFAVSPAPLGKEWQITHLNLNDGTVEGLKHRKLPIFSLQYHPEASPGPHDSLGYFDLFIKEMRHAQA